MDYKIFWSAEAEEDLVKYLSQFEFLGKTHYINGLLKVISELLNLLSKTPFMHPIWDFDIHVAPLRKIPYTLYYIVDNDKKIITIIGLLHQKQDNSIVSIRE